MKEGRAEKYIDNWQKIKRYIYLHSPDNFFHNLWHIRPHFVFTLPRTPYKVVVIHSKLPNEDEGLTEVISADCIAQLLSMQVVFVD